MIDLGTLRGGLIVSCQAQPGGPLCDVGIMVVLAPGAPWRSLASTREAIP